MENLAMNWCKRLNAVIRFNEPLSKHTTLRVGPIARIWIEPHTLGALKSIIKKAKAEKEDYLVIGAGSKLLITKKEIPLAIHLGRGVFTDCRSDDNNLIAGAGAPLAKVIRVAYENSLGGLEFLSGIPATVGGALALNAGVGWPERIEMGSFVDRLEVIDANGELKILRKKDLKFGYRFSNLRNYIIVKARFTLFKKRKKNIKKRIAQFLEYRKKTQSIGSFSAGCVFKNVAGHSSGKLIDVCGLKGAHRGDAVISSVHANFIINQGQATAKDILALMSLMKKEVKKKFKLDLEPEIEIV